jgi:RNA-directed DNA polymerase
MSNILDLSPNDARKFLLKEESYINFDLPPYFKFSNILNKVSLELVNKPLDRDREGIKVFKKSKKVEDVNYKLLSNKDGKYGWRPFQIIHPVLYVSLVHEITSKRNWKILQRRFDSFNSNTCVECVSVPIVSSSPQSDRAEQVQNWVDQVEQRSIALGLSYEYFFEADIADCYGSIYTHSIPWAIYTKDVAKKERDPSLIGNSIDQHLQAMSFGQTNGIPQGSVTMDLIAEIVLGYADELLKEKINSIEATEYKIIRYRDDYRIFVNSPKVGENILRNLTEVLSDLGFKLNTHKIDQTNDIISSSIKPDKLYNLTNEIVNTKIQQELLIIYSISKKFPNSGTVSKKLNSLHSRITKINKKETIFASISILVNIALYNPRSYSIVAAILSKLLSFLNNDEKEKTFEKIRKKFEQVPNTGILQIWLQRICIKFDRQVEYDEKLCEVVKNTKGKVEIWNSGWINDMDKVLSITYIDESEISRLDPVISAKEVELFREYPS